MCCTKCKGKRLESFTKMTFRCVDCGTWNRGKEQLEVNQMFVSERGEPLITQFLDLYTNPTKGYLTVEDYLKWYKTYKISVDGHVTPLDPDIYIEPLNGLMWVNHVINPECFHLTAESLNLRYDNKTFARVCEKWVTVYLDGDWTELHNYLPRKS